MDHFGAYIRTRREELRLSQTTLALAIGASQAAVSRLESSKEAPSDFRLLAKLARALKQPLSEFLKSTDILASNVLTEEEFFAFCPNPFCDTNELTNGRQGILVYWSSWASYPGEQFLEINFCPCCGTEFVKECGQCKRRFPKKESRYCIRCGEKICHRPTEEEWAIITEMFNPSSSTGTEELGTPSSTGTEELGTPSSTGTEELGTPSSTGTEELDIPF
jgi:transcriptional regulator with XRE-family HTH domain